MNESIEKPVKTEYILCFPPREKLAGNFFSQIKSVLKWHPEIKNEYSYPPVAGERNEVIIHQVVCLFMEQEPVTAKGDGLAKLWLQWQKSSYVRKMYAEKGLAEERGETGAVCRIHEMQYKQDYPYSLRIYFVQDFFEHLNWGKKTRIGIIEGDAIKRRDLILMLRQYYDRMNYLTVFSREKAAYDEFAEDAWEQYGLAVTVTDSLREMELCDYILDCTMMPFAAGIRLRKGCRFLSVYGDREKIRSIRKAGEGVNFDSCAGILDRAFHNKV
ncbi:MAG: hypothetical protein J6K58_11250 [Lachnospiraceae bacterium]|nr:hypothetical protein [Lachnospiraceae bacterium]